MDRPLTTLARGRKLWKAGAATRRAALLIGIVLACLPNIAAAEEAVTRREGFLLIWQSIRRPAAETNETPYIDVPEGSDGFLEITYGKTRGMLDDAEAFRPGDVLLLRDAVLWLLRTRNVDDPDLLTAENLPILLKRYPFVHLPGHEEDPLTRGDLLGIMRTFDDLLAKEVHEVSLYAESFHGRGTAFGETFDMHAITAAHRTFPWNTLVRVTNVESGKSVVVRINDRGPFVEGRDMDLSLASFSTIADRRLGKIRATFERLGDRDLVSGCGEEPRYQERITRDVRLRRGIPHTLTLGKTLTLGANRAFAVIGLRYPDDTVVRTQDWILPGESFTFTPSIEGGYAMTLRTIEGRRRTFRMNVVRCS